MRVPMVSRWSHRSCSPTSVKPGGRASALGAKLTATHREEDNVTNTTPEDIAGRLEAMEERLARLETLLVGLTQQLERQRTAPTQAVESIQTWVTDYVSMRLQRPVPETCKHAPESEAAMGLIFPGPPCHVLTTSYTGWGVSQFPLCARWSSKKSPSRPSTNMWPAW